VTIVAPLNVPSLLGEDASELYAKNQYNLLALMMKDNVIDDRLERRGPRQNRPHACGREQGGGERRKAAKLSLLRRPPRKPQTSPA
jgi:hypothetical protein